MSVVEALNARFGIGQQVVFRQDASGLVVVDIENAQASARLCLQGAHVLNWRPRATSIPVVWMSESARLEPGVSTHCGVPVCWPWFGAHPEGLPAHGFARNLPWDVVETASTPEGATRVCLSLSEPVQPRFGWPHAATLELKIVIGDSLQLELVTSNTGTEDFVVGEAYHTYFQVGDIARTRVSGLDGVTYADKVEDYARSVQHGDITFSGETDRVYLDTAAECVIVDEALRRRIRIAKSGSRSTVVWTPWQEKAALMVDIGEAGWRHMLCVESANALDNRVTVPAGATHTLAVEYRVEAF